MKPALSLSLQFADASDRAVLPRHKVARWIRAALSAPAEITVRIVGAEEGQALNRDYRSKSSWPTWCCARRWWRVRRAR
jgi:probable rRNA maturation factor